MNLSEYFLRLQ